MRKTILFIVVLFMYLAVNASAQTWTAQTSPTTASLNCVSAVDANVAWIGADTGIVLKTTNAGTTWTKITSTTIGTNSIYAICGLSATTCLVSTSPSATYVFKTTDGGTTWTQVFTQAGGFVDDIRFKDANTGFMYGDPVSSRWSLWKTTNAGTTWDSTGLYLPMTGTEAGWNNAMQIDGNTIWFGTNNTKVYKSTNFGATGSWISGATTGTANSYSVAFNNLIGFSGQTVAVKSTDGGATYASATLPGSGTCYSFNTIIGANRFWYNRGSIIYGSTDNGTNFASQYTATAGTFQAMNMVQSGSVIRGWSVSNTGLIIMYNETYIPTPTTPVWTAQTSPTTASLNCVSTVDANVAWIGADTGIVLKTTNAGTTWTKITSTTIGTNSIYAICGLSATTCLVSTSPSATYVFKTTDGGTTWTQVFTQAGGFVDDIRFKDANTGFMYGDPVSSRWSLWKTTNAGTTWDSTGLYLPMTGTEAGWNNAMQIDGNTIWFGTNNTKVYKSTNFGATGSWISGATTGTANSYSVAFNNLIGFSGQTVAVKSTDGGATYASATLPGSGTCYSFNTVKNCGRFWYNRGSIIYGSTDNGANFAAQYTATAGTFQAMSIILSGTTLRGFSVSNTGLIIMFDQQNVVTGVSQINSSVPENYSLSQNYPNPFNPTTKIQFAIPKNGFVTLKVYNILGKEVATLLSETKNAGTYSVDFNASHLSSGVYFYKLESNGFSSIKKMMLVK